MQARRYVPVAVMAVTVILLHVVLSAAHHMSYMTQITMSVYYALVVIGLCLLMGYAGQASLGHAAFFAIGGYTVAWMTTVNFTARADAGWVRGLDRLGLLVQWHDLYGREILSFSAWPAFLTALVLTGLIALVIGAPMIRLKGHYLAMATLGFGLIVYCIVNATKGLGQADGIHGVPPFHLIPGLEVNGRAPFLVENYYIAWTAVLVAMILAINLIHSRVGRALRSIHQNEEAAHSLGVNTYRYKLAVFVLSALFAAVGGALLTHYNASIGPGEASVMKSVRYVAIVAIGGMANLWGAMVMAVLLNFLSLKGVFQPYDDAVFAAILIVIMLFAPQGLLRMPKWRTIASLGRVFSLVSQKVVRGRTTSTRRAHG
jgi:branched-chain amino acid transport system permease protein